MADFPVRREWLEIPYDDPEFKTPVIARFSAVTYNVLAQLFIKRETYPFASKSALRLQNRFKQLITEISRLNADIVALQEVDNYHEMWEPKLRSMGYELYYLRKQDAPFRHRVGTDFTNPCKRGHGLLLAFKKSKFQVIATRALFFEELADEYSNASPQSPSSSSTSSSSESSSGSVSADTSSRDTSVDVVADEFRKPNVAQMLALRLRRPSPQQSLHHQHHHQQQQSSSSSSLQRQRSEDKGHKKSKSNHNINSRSQSENSISSASSPSEPSSSSSSLLPLEIVTENISFDTATSPSASTPSSLPPHSSNFSRSSSSNSSTSSQSSSSSSLSSFFVDANYNGTMPGLIVSNIHAHWNPKFQFVRVRQVEKLLSGMCDFQRELAAMSSSSASSPSSPSSPSSSSSPSLPSLSSSHTSSSSSPPTLSNYPLLLLGDFNSCPNDPPYRFLADPRGRSFHLESPAELRWFLTPLDHVRDFYARQEAKKALEQGSEKKAKQEHTDSPDTTEASSSEPLASTSSSSSTPAAAASKSLVSDLNQVSSWSEADFLNNFPALDDPSAQSRLEEVKRFLEKSQQLLPLLQSAYSSYQSLASASAALLQPSAHQLALQPRWLGEPPITNFGEKWSGTLDYLFTVPPMRVSAPSSAPSSLAASPHSAPDSNGRSSSTQLLSEASNSHSAGSASTSASAPGPGQARFYLHPRHILSIPDVSLMQMQTAMPSDLFASDHVSLMAVFELAQQLE